MAKILISLSDDVIFTPSTQTTRYSMNQAIKSNLKRRMPEFDVSIGRVAIDDDHTYVHVALKTEIHIEDRTFQVAADCAASPSDLMVKELTFEFEGSTQTVRPAPVSRTPEAVVGFVHRLTQLFSKQVDQWSCRHH